jgi:hypothetical protein
MQALLYKGTTGLMLGALAAGPGQAQSIALSITIPSLDVAEYHRPYVAIWLEGADQPRTLALWYDHDNREEGGTRWLHDLRQWWRTAGRTLALPADGITGATRAPGTHRLRFTPGAGAMPLLKPGAYTLVVEAAREVGGRELVRLPFTWPGSATTTARGQTELGSVILSTIAR